MNTLFVTMHVRASTTLVKLKVASRARDPEFGCIRVWTPDSHGYSSALFISAPPVSSHGAYRSKYARSSPEQGEGRCPTREKKGD